MDADMPLPAIALLVLAAVAFFAVRRNARGANMLVLVAVAGALVFFGLSLFGRKEDRSSSRLASDEAAAGAVLARIFSSDVKDGSVLVLRNPSNEKLRNEMSAHRYAGFSGGAGAVRLVQAGPNLASFTSNDPAFTQFGSETLADDIARWLADHKEVRTVVSLLGTMPRLPSDRTAYGFIDLRDTGWPAEIKNGRVKAAVMYRLQPLPPDTKPEANNGLPPKFILVTKDNLDEAVKALSF